MSRIANVPIVIPSDVTVALEGRVANVFKGASRLTFLIPDQISLDIKEGKISVFSSQEGKKASAMLGTVCRIVSNMILGVSKGFQKVIELVGVGYKAELQGRRLKLSLGFSHDIFYDLPEGISVTMEKPTVFKIIGIDKQKVGQVTADIVRFRPPEPYKGKGARISGQYIHRKSGKSK